MGGQRPQVEPTKEELSVVELARSPPSPDDSVSNDSVMNDSVTTDTDFCDTDFCDSLLNSVPNTMCHPVLDSSACDLDMDCASLYDNINSGSVMPMPDFDSLKLDYLDLECFLAAPVPLAC